MNLIKFWQFLFPPNDWTVVWNIKGNWYSFGTPDINDGNVFYVIEFSKFRDKFRLEYSGDNPKSHQLRNVALSKLSEYNNNLLEIQFNSKKKQK